MTRPHCAVWVMWTGLSASVVGAAAPLVQDQRGVFSSRVEMVRGKPAKALLAELRDLVTAETRR